jgi:cell division protein FtsI (penicillin-binding protein 3)
MLALAPLVAGLIAFSVREAGSRQIAHPQTMPAVTALSWTETGLHLGFADGSAYRWDGAATRPLQPGNGDLVEAIYPLPGGSGEAAVVTRGAGGLVLRQPSGETRLLPAEQMYGMHFAMHESGAAAMSGVMAFQTDPEASPRDLTERWDRMIWPAGPRFDVDQRLENDFPWSTAPETVRLATPRNPNARVYAAGLDFQRVREENPEFEGTHGVGVFPFGSEGETDAARYVHVPGGVADRVAIEGPTSEFYAANEGAPVEFNRSGEFYILATASPSGILASANLSVPDLFDTASSAGIPSSVAPDIGFLAPLDRRAWRPVARLQPGDNAYAASPLAREYASLMERGARSLLRGDVRTEANEGATSDPAAELTRGDLLARDGQVFATNLATHSLFADPAQIWDVRETVDSLASILPGLDVEELALALDSRRRFIWIQRNLTPRQRAAVTALGLPGLDFVEEPRRIYPRGRLAAHAIGYVDRELQGLAGAERAFDPALIGQPGRDVVLSLDLSVQFALDTELRAAMEEYQAQAAAGLVMNVRTGELLAMSSLPDFDPNLVSDVEAEALLNRASQSVYEFGSIFKGFTVALALETGIAEIDQTIDASEPIEVGGVRISDFDPADRSITLAEVLAHSSNIGAAQLALDAGPEAQRDLLDRLGLLDRAPIELAESQAPLLPGNWGDAETATIAYGHGIAVSPLALASAFTAIANYGRLARPTLLRVGLEDALTSSQVLDGDTAAELLLLMRNAVTDGTAVRAQQGDIPVAGLVGTAEKPSSEGYDADRLLASFVGLFPAEAPRYLVLTLLDEPQGTPDTFGYTTGGWTAAPTAGAVIARIGPSLLGEGADPLSLLEQADQTVYPPEFFESYLAGSVRTARAADGREEARILSDGRVCIYRLTDDREMACLLAGADPVIVWGEEPRPDEPSPFTDPDTPKTLFVTSTIDGARRTFAYTAQALDPVAQLELSRDGTRLLARGVEGGVELWDLRTGDILFRAPYRAGAPVLSAALSPAGDRVAVADATGVVQVWALTEVESPLNAPPGGGAVSPDYGYAPLARIRAHDDYVAHIAFSPDGAQLATGGLDGHVRITDLAAARWMNTPWLPPGFLERRARAEDATTAPGAPAVEPLNGADGFDQRASFDRDCLPSRSVPGSEGGGRRVEPTALFAVALADNGATFLDISYASSGEDDAVQTGREIAEAVGRPVSAPPPGALDELAIASLADQLHSNRDCRYSVMIIGATGNPSSADMSTPARAADLRAALDTHFIVLEAPPNQIPAD